MSNRGLFSRLEQGQLSAGEDPVASITEHLRALLNTRKGEAVASPNYGILDFNDIVHLMPFAITKMQSSIQSAVQEFEPRLRNVTVRYVEDEVEPTALRFDVSAQLALKGVKGQLLFRTRLLPGGRVEVW